MPTTVMTVLGPVDVSTLGTTITHEHLVIDLSSYVRRPVEASALSFHGAPVTLENLGQVRRNPYGNLDNCLLTDVPLAIDEAMQFKNLGGETIVDVTLPDIGRDPAALRVISRATGLNVIAGCGHYIAQAHPPTVADQSVDAIAARLVDEIENGIGDTGVRPGIIGEIGTGHPIHPEEVKVLRAAAAAHSATGLAVTIHVHPPGRRGNEVLDILEGEGMSLDRVILGHVDVALGHLDVTFDEAVHYHRSLLDRGCYLEFDLCGNDGYFVLPENNFWMPSDRERARALACHVDAGFGDKLLLSQDVGHKHYLTRYGGWGYGHVLGPFTTYMREAGIADEAITRMFVDNPRDVLAVGRS